MRVLFLSQIVPYPPHGGVLQRGFNLLREVGRHAEVTLLAYVHPDELSADRLEEARHALGAFCTRIEFFPLRAKGSAFDRVSTLTRGLASARPFSVAAHRSTAFGARVREIMEAGGCDVVHVDTVALSQFVPARPALPTVLTHHNIESLLMARRAQFERRALVRAVLARESRKLTRYEAASASQYHVHVLVSADDEAVLKARVPAATTAVVPNGVDTAYFSPTWPDGGTSTLVYTGGMNMFANRDAVLFFLREIWPRLTAARANVRFVSIGEAPPQELLDAAAADPRVVALGRVPDIRPHVREAAIYVVPLRVGGGTRLKVLDAMAMGKALVATSIGCEGIDIAHGEQVLLGDTPDAFASHVLALLDDPQRRDFMGRAARRRAEERYAWPIIGRRLMDAYAAAADLAGARQ